MGSHGQNNTQLSFGTAYLSSLTYSSAINNFSIQTAITKDDLMCLLANKDFNPNERQMQDRCKLLSFFGFFCVMEKMAKNGSHMVETLLYTSKLP